MESGKRNELGVFDVRLGPHSYEDVRFFTVQRPKGGQRYVGFEFYPEKTRFVFDPESILNMRYRDGPAPKVSCGGVLFWEIHSTNQVFRATRERNT